jgi:hypothetical protein
MPIFQFSRFLFVLFMQAIRSNDYSNNDCSSSFKAILLNKVIVGKGCKLTQDNVSLTAPPAGYDSVSDFYFA